jgi:hypothetical protein
VALAVADDGRLVLFAGYLPRDVLRVAQAIIDADHKLDDEGRDGHTSRKQKLREDIIGASDELEELLAKEFAPMTCPACEIRERRRRRASQ